MPMLPVLPPEPPAAEESLGSPDEAAARWWQALTQGIAKRLSRLLEGVLHPSVAVAASAQQPSRGASAERTFATTSSAAAPPTPATSAARLN